MISSESSSSAFGDNQNQKQQQLRGPIFSLTHGAGPLPLEGQQDSLVRVWNQLSSKVLVPSRPDAIVVISAHYHSEKPKVMVPKPDQKYFTLKFDYAGFPERCYRYQFAPRGHAGVANAILEEMRKMPILADAELDESGCLDHGCWVPMVKMLPTKHGEEEFDSINQQNSNFAASSYNNNHHHHSVASNRTHATSSAASTAFTLRTARSSSTSAALSIAPSSSFSLFSVGGGGTSSSSSSIGGVSTTSLQYCDIPIVPVSVSSTSDPAVQLAIGEAIRNALLKPLPSSKSANNGSTTSSVVALGERKVNDGSVVLRSKSVSIITNCDQQQKQENTAATLTTRSASTTGRIPKVAIIASGSINHNFRRQVLFGGGVENNNNNGKNKNQSTTIKTNFNENLKRILSDESISPQDRKEIMLRWRSSIPGSSVYQPVKPGKNGSSDHFMPLLSVIAASGYQPISSSVTYDYFGAPCSDFIWK